jgi:hypothetical protein
MPLHTFSTYTLRPDVAEVLRSTVYGLPGKLRYRQLDAADKCARLPHTRWLLLEKNDRLLGNAALLERPTEIAGQIVSSAYVRYLSMPTGVQNTQARQHPNKMGVIRQALANELAKAPEALAAQARVMFAYVEADNLPSQHLCASFGMQAYRQLGTCISSRFAPKVHSRFRLLRSNEKAQMLERLEAMYANRHFFFPNELYGHGDYYVITNEQDEILVGALVFRCDWEVVEIPGLEGWLVKRLFPHLPLLKRLFPKDKLSFAALEGLWFKPGHEHLLGALFSSCTASLGLHVSMFWDDAASEVFETVKRQVKPGLIGRLSNLVHADILMRVWRGNDALEKALRETPVYVSAHDLT